MSIIHDALKKAQADLKSKTGEDIGDVYPKMFNEEIRKGRPSVSQEALIHNRLKPQWLRRSLKVSSLFAALALGALLVTSLSSRLFTTADTKTVSSAKSTQAPVVKSQPSYAPALFSSQSKPKSNLVLSGTLSSADQRVAIINDEIYQLGDTVAGKTITSIALNGVELSDKDGEITTLRQSE